MSEGYVFRDPELAKAARIAKDWGATMRSSVIGSGTTTSSTNPYGGQANQANAAQAAASAIATFLKIAPTKYYPILGTLAAGTTGGANANVIWQQPIPIIPAFCTAIDYTIQLPLSLTLGSTTGAATASPFAPYSGFMQQMTLGGAPPWPMTEFTPWYLDAIKHRIDYDWADAGQNQYGNTNPATYPNNTLDQGPIPVNINQLIAGATFTPGATYTNVTGAQVTTNFSINFRVRQQLQRKRHLLWGSVPFGDPENRPNNLVQMSPGQGVNPEQVMFVSNVAGGGGGSSTAVTAANTCNVYAKYELRYIDLLPDTLTSVPQPLVNYGLQLTPFSVTNLVPGTIQPITHRTAQIYTSIDHILINNQLPLRADYFGLWDDQDQQSARYSYDAQANSFTEWFDKMQATYRRYFNLGHYFVDMENGIFPEIPSVTPYDALMSPDAGYAAAFGVPITPAMTTSLRIPSATVASSPYARTYSLGLVRVPY
jgi:hypothetical protein